MLMILVGILFVSVDKKIIFVMLEQCGGVKKCVVELFGISFKMFYNWLEEYGNSNVDDGGDGNSVGFGCVYVIEV